MKTGEVRIVVTNNRQCNGMHYISTRGSWKVGTNSLVGPAGLRVCLSTPRVPSGLSKLS
jgi:hypothetical protein